VYGYYIACCIISKYILRLPVTGSDGQMAGCQEAAP
jgi:hypothetical protein